jgi:hypothetical protein
MDPEPAAQVYEVFVQRGSRRLKVREPFASREAARAYVRQQWATRSLGYWCEEDERGELPGELMILAGNESYWIRSVRRRPVCQVPQPTSGDSAARDVPSPGRRTGLSFEEWVNYAFDHPVPQKDSEAWYWQLETDDWSPYEDPRTTVCYLTQLFDAAPRMLQPFSDAQIAQGLMFLINNSLSDHMFPLMDPSVPWPERRGCIRSMYVVFEQVFAPRCSPLLLHVLTEHEPTINPLNGVCYMWWDVCPLRGNPGPSASEHLVLDTEEVVDKGPTVDPFAAELEDEILEVLRQTLGLDSIACQEGALHGLGHRAYRHPERIRAIVDEFLSRRYPGWPEGALDEALRGYALAAGQGRVQ